MAKGKQHHTLPLAARMQIMKEAEQRRLVQETTELCMKLYYRAGGVALNRVFGFGEKKIMEFQHELQRIMAEVRAEKEEVDFEYAFDMLSRAYEQIVPE